MPREYTTRRQGGNDGRRNGRGNGRSNRGSSGAPAWMWLFVGLTIGLLVAAAIYIRKPGLDIVKGKPDAAEPAAAEPQPALPEQPEPEESAAASSDSRFEFYEMLPNYEVVIPAGEYLPKEGEDKPALKEPGQYVIQAGSFRTHTDADRRKASLALLGIESHIEKITVGDEAQTWYRVRVGPEKDLAVINEQLRLLRENKIDAILIRIKS